MANVALDIVSAFWGPLDVTDRVRDLYYSQAQPGSTTFSFEVSDKTLGSDPAHGVQKCLVVVWRVIFQGNGDFQFQYSVVQTERVLDSGTVTIDFSKPVPVQNIVHPTSSLLVSSATYFNKDVTETVASKNNDSGTPAFRVWSDVLGGDPQPGVKKPLTVTYAYIRPDGYLAYNMVIANDRDVFSLPNAYMF